MWEDKLANALATRKEESTDEKVAITTLAKGTRIITAGGQVALITGHKTTSTIQVKLIATNTFDWLSNIARVHLAR